MTDNTLIHEAVARAGEAIKAQHGGTVPDGLQLLQYAFSGNVLALVALECRMCDSRIDAWYLQDYSAHMLAEWAPVSALVHACWQLQSLAVPTLAETVCDELTDRTPATVEETYTPREALHREAMWGLMTGGSDVAATRADELIDAYTADLAEKQRAWAQTREAEEEKRHGFIDHETQLITEAITECADLIDPKAVKP